ncbi:hypothetical protein J3T78_05845 [Staphylococcus nepalensis]|uniref:hypothetical protein n=1 Tax=Staphylococcus nepalensis TaxID=214473 RepID=UPI001A9A2AFB|nr:hypothetical protein [Staphylococcus nepalensis]MBO1217507.1 hypothetical protein [Staphylococcus nepalensis]MBO1237235.1 hypothetical protein [Staphylococcus nepalensis]
MAIYIFCGLLTLIAFISLLKNAFSNNKNKNLDVLSSVLLLISSIKQFWVKILGRWFDDNKKKSV